MKIIYPAFIRLPTEKAHGAQIMKTCEALAALGHTVELVIPGRRNHIPEDAFSYYGVQKNFSIINVHTPDVVRWGILGFSASLLWFSEAVKWQRSFWQADIIYSRDAGLLLQYLLLGRKLVYEAHTKPTYISRIVARRAYRVVVISEGLYDAYRALGVNPERMVVAHDGVDAEAFAHMPTQHEARQTLGLTAGRIALYVGRVDAAKGVDTLAAASEFLDDTTHIGIVGDGPLRTFLQKKYPRVLFVHETPYRELPTVLAAADILVAPNSATDTDASRYTSPLKAFAYLAAKKPIIATRVPALTAVFQDSATYVSADAPQELASAIMNPASYEHMPTTLPHTWRDRAQIIERLLT